MKTHVWIKGIGEEQFAPIATLVLAITSPFNQDCTAGQRGEKTFLANGIVITKYQWEVLKEQIGVYSACLDNMSSGY